MPLKQVDLECLVKNYKTNGTIIKHIDDTWNADLLDFNDYKPANNKGNRYILTVIDNFSKFAGTIPLKNTYAQTIKNSFENIIITSKENHIL